MRTALVELAQKSCNCGISWKLIKKFESIFICDIRVFPHLLTWKYIHIQRIDILEEGDGIVVEFSPHQLVRTTPAAVNILAFGKITALTFYASGCSIGIHKCKIYIYTFTFMYGTLFCRKIHTPLTTALIWPQKQRAAAPSIELSSVFHPLMVRRRETTKLRAIIAPPPPFSPNRLQSNDRMRGKVECRDFDERDNRTQKRRNDAF